ncbi:MAG: hypothetical protein K5848_04925 [Lachnospiraceae bacterium]|nr:hypothetical protein [Lachnospiraceae bacterium]
MSYPRGSRTLKASCNTHINQVFSYFPFSCFCLSGGNDYSFPSDLQKKGNKVHRHRNYPDSHHGRPLC